MANREIPEAEMHALALVNLQAAIVEAAFALFREAIGRLASFKLDHRQRSSMDTHTNLVLQATVSAKACASEAYTAINLATRMATNFPQYSSNIQDLQRTLNIQFPELRAVRNSFAHIDERATKSHSTGEAGDAESRLWGLQGNVLSVRGAKGQLVELTLSARLPEAINCLTDGMIGMFPKKPTHDKAMDNFLAGRIEA